MSDPLGAVLQYNDSTGRAANTNTHVCVRARACVRTCVCVCVCVRACQRACVRACVHIPSICGVLAWQAVFNCRRGGTGHRADPVSPEGLGHACQGFPSRKHWLYRPDPFSAGPCPFCTRARRPGWAVCLTARSSQAESYLMFEPSQKWPGTPCRLGTVSARSSSPCARCPWYPQHVLFASPERARTKGAPWQPVRGA